MASAVLDAIASLGGLLLALAAFGLSFGESAVGLDLIVPGEVGMVIAGATAARNGTPIVVILLCGYAGAILGDCTGYAVGRRFGTEVVSHWRWTRRTLGPSLERATDYFEDKGGWAVFAARWIGALRAVVPLVAGSAKMPFGRFVLWDIPAVLSWMTAVVLAGYFLGDRIADTVDTYGLFLSAGLVLIIGTVFLIRRHRKRNEAADDKDKGDGEKSAAPVG